MINKQLFKKNIIEIFIICLIVLIFITPNLILNNNLNSSNWDTIFLFSYFMRWPVGILGMIYLVFKGLEYDYLEEDFQEHLTKDSLELMKNFQKHSFNLFKEQVDEWSREFIEKAKDNQVEFTFEDIELGINKNKIKKPYHELRKPPARTTQWVWMFLLNNYLSIQKKIYKPSEVDNLKKVDTFFKKISTGEDFKKLQDGLLYIKADKLVFNETKQFIIKYSNISKIGIRGDGIEIKILEGDYESIYFKTKNFYIIFFTLVFAKDLEILKLEDLKVDLSNTVNKLADDFYKRFRLDLEVSKKLLSGDNKIVNNFLNDNKLGTWENYRKGGNLDFSKVFAPQFINITEKN